MSSYRLAIEEALEMPVKVVVVDVEKEFIHLDKHNGAWRLTITKSLLKEEVSVPISKFKEPSNGRR